MYNLTYRDAVVISSNTRDYADVHGSMSATGYGKNIHVSADTSSTHRTITEVWVKNPAGRRPPEENLTFRDVELGVREGHEIRLIYSGQDMACVRNFVTGRIVYFGNTVSRPRNRVSLFLKLGVGAGLFCLVEGFCTVDSWDRGTSLRPFYGLLLFFVCSIGGYIYGKFFAQKKENQRCANTTRSLQALLDQVSTKGRS
jgi:hypothetical protein